MKWMEHVDEQYVMSGIETTAYLAVIVLRSRNFLSCQMIRTQ